MSREVFSLKELADRVTGGNLPAMAKLLNDAGARPRLDELEPEPSTPISRLAVIDLFAMRSEDRVGRALARLLSQSAD